MTQSIAVNMSLTIRDEETNQHTPVPLPRVCFSNGWEGFEVDTRILLNTGDAVLTYTDKDRTAISITNDAELIKGSFEDRYLITVMGTEKNEYRFFYKDKAVTRFIELIKGKMQSAHSL